VPRDNRSARSREAGEWTRGLARGHGSATGCQGGHFGLRVLGGCCRAPVFAILLHPLPRPPLGAGDGIPDIGLDVQIKCTYFIHTWTPFRSAGMSARANRTAGNTASPSMKPKVSSLTKMLFSFPIPIIGNLRNVFCFLESQRTPVCLWCVTAIEKTTVLSG
jgi:hypothetical protein